MEILISIALIGVGLVAVVGVFPMGLSYMRIMGERVFVVQQAQAQLEYFKRLDYKLIKNMANANATIAFDPLINLVQLSYDDPNGDAYGIADPNDVLGNRYNGFRSIATFTNESGITEPIVRIRVEIYWIESTPYGKMTSEWKSYMLEGYKGEGVK